MANPIIEVFKPVAAAASISGAYGGPDKYIAYPAAWSAALAAVSGQVFWGRADFGTFLDVGRLIPTTNDGDAIAAWRDLSGSGNHVIQATAANRPLLKANIQNSLPVLRFDGVNDWLGVTFASVAQPLTIFGAFKQTSGSYILDGSSANNVALWFNTGAGPGLRIFSGTANINYTETQPLGPSVFTCLFNGASSLIRKDQVQKVTGNPGANSLNGLSLGVIGSRTVSFSAMDWYELFVYAGDKTANFSLFENYLKTRWGTP